MGFDNKKIQRIKDNFPQGTRIQLDHMNDPYSPVPDGTIGTVELVDDAGQIHMNWDNGRGLALIPSEDSFSLISRPEIKEEQIQVVLIKANEHPIIVKIDNTLEKMQEIVGGYIEEIYLDDSSVLICNEEGKLNNLEVNRRINDDIIAGSFFIAGDNGSENLVSLSDKQAQEYLKKYYDIEHHAQEEMFDSMQIKVYGGM